MKQFISLLVLVVVFSGCQNLTGKVIPTKDTGYFNYWPTKKIPPATFFGAWTISGRNLPRKDDSSRNELQADTTYTAKLADTTSDGHGHQKYDSLGHAIPTWYVVPDSLKAYIHIIPKPNR